MAAPTIAQQIGGIDGSGNLQSMSVDTSGRVNVNINGTVPVSGTVSVAKTSLTGSSPTTVSVGTSSTTVLASNSSRKGLVLTNTTSLATISLHLNSGTAVLNSGITLYPHDSWIMDEYTFTTGAINGIASLAASGLAIQEFT